MQLFVRYDAGHATSRDRNNVCARWELTVKSRERRLQDRSRMAYRQTKQSAVDHQTDRREALLHSGRRGAPLRSRAQGYSGRSGCHRREVRLKSILLGQIQNVWHFLMRLQSGFVHGHAGAQIPAFQCGRVEMATGAAGNVWV